MSNPPLTPSRLWWALGGTMVVLFVCVAVSPAVPPGGLLDTVWAVVCSGGVLTAFLLAALIHRAQRPPRRAWRHHR